MRYLRKKGRRHILPWNEKLAKRQDIEEVTADGRPILRRSAESIEAEVQAVVEPLASDAQPVDLEAMNRYELIRYGISKGLKRASKTKSVDLIAQLKAMA